MGQYHSRHPQLSDRIRDRRPQGDYPELELFRRQIVQGANTELHELEVGSFSELVTESYGIDLEAKRIEHKGTNSGTDDIEGWWQDAADAYGSGNKEQAYFYLGVMLHMIEDMGVPAHAHGLIHQGMATNFDNFEFMALSNWRPDVGMEGDKADPGYNEPWKYYAFSKAWALEDAPGYTDIDSFSKFWTFASDDERRLLGDRQLRTAIVVTWVLNSAAKAFGP